MKQTDLLKAMNGIDDDFLLDAHQSISPLRINRLWRRGMIAAVVAVCMTITVIAVAPQFVKLVGSSEEAKADMEQQLAEYGDAAANDMSPIKDEVWTGEEAAENAVRVVRRWIDRVYQLMDTEVLSDQTGGATWSRKVTYLDDGQPGCIYEAKDVTTILKNDRRFEADFSYLDQIAEPVENSIWLENRISLIDPEEGTISTNADLGATYLLPSGGAVSIEVHADSNYVQRALTTYGAEFTFLDTVTSADGVDFTIFGLSSGRIFVRTFQAHALVNFVAFSSSREEVEDIIRHCFVGKMLENLSTIGEE